MSLRIAMECRIACNNIIHELDRLACCTEHWGIEDHDSNLRNTGLELQLYCEAAAGEVNATKQVLDSLVSGTHIAGTIAQAVLEMQIRLENALEEVGGLNRIVEGFDGVIDPDVAFELKILEMDLRAGRIQAKLKGLKPKFDALAGVMQRPTIQSAPGLALAPTPQAGQ